MYGYVQIYQPELKFREYDEYRSYYCGLCRSLQHQFGYKGKFLLSYDITFLTLLLDGLYEPVEYCQTCRCAARCGQKQSYQSSEILTYTANMNILLSYYKCKDDWRDNHNIGKFMMSKMMNKKIRTLNATYSKKIIAIEKQFDRLWNIEKIKDPDFDAASGCFGNMLAEIFAYQEDIWTDLLRKLGFYLGKFIYLLDAFDDMEQDQKKKNYNPFLLSGASVRQCVIQCESLLSMMMAECVVCFERLPIIKHDMILRNILYSGVWQKFYKKKKVLV